MGVKNISGNSSSLASCEMSGDFPLEASNNKHSNLEMLNKSIYKIVLSIPAKPKSQVNSSDKAQESICEKPQENAGKAPLQYTRAEIIRSGDIYQLSMYTTKQVFHSNFQELGPVIDELFGTTFMQYHAWDNDYEYSAKISKKGKVLTSRKKAKSQAPKLNLSNGSFNRQKNYIIKEGEPIPVLADMGIFTKEGKIAAQMRDKFGQINRFLELIADETGPDAIPTGTTINIIDFGCGKSYLTFLVYHYFTKIRNHKVNICGLDLDAKIVENCTTAAEKYGYTSLWFVEGDIGQQTTPPIEGWGTPNTFNIVISLHACDTATDHALYNAIKWSADLICAAPCCQHELKKQMKPKSLALLNRYGIIKERMAALATDAIRSNLLECCGYKTQIIEFTDMAQTSKNLLIRARKRAGKGSAAIVDSKDIRNNAIVTKAQSEVESIIKEFCFEPTLLRLLQESGYV